MGMYADQVLPRVLNLAMNTAVNREIRERVCAGLEGEVVEIGFGTGLNLPHLPHTVTRLRVVDPSELGARIAAARVADSPIPVQRAGLDGERLPFEDASVDAVLCTWTLCTIPDAVAAVREVRRVLKPGGFTSTSWSTGSALTRRSRGGRTGSTRSRTGSWPAATSTATSPR